MHKKIKLIFPSKFRKNARKSDQTEAHTHVQTKMLNRNYEGKEIANFYVHGP